MRARSTKGAYNIVSNITKSLLPVSALFGTSGDNPHLDLIKWVGKIMNLTADPEENRQESFSEDRIEDRRGWILVLLYTPEDGEVRSVESRDALRFKIFLLDSQLKEHFNESTHFEFESSKTGPTDPELDVILDRLIKDDLICEAKSNEGGISIALTESGERKAEPLWCSLEKNKKDLFKWVKYSPRHSPPESLMASLYRKYPSMFGTGCVE